MNDTFVLALKIIKSEVVVYFGLWCYEYALNFLFVYWPYQGHVGYLEESKMCLFCLYAATKSGIHACANEHETGLVHEII